MEITTYICKASCDSPGHNVRFTGSRVTIQFHQSPSTGYQTVGKIIPVHYNPVSVNVDMTFYFRKWIGIHLGF